MRLRVLAVAPLLAGGLAATAPAHHAAAAAACPTLGTTLLTLASTVTPSDGGSTFIVCTGRVPSFDGTPLRVDVSVPTAPYIPPGSTAPAPQRPLMMFLHGYSNDRCQFESTTLAGSPVPNCPDFIGNAGYHWNNAYFASQGWVALNFTSRGWFDSCGKVGPGDPYYPEYPAGYSYLTDAQNCDTTNGRASWVHLYDRRYEIRDAQFLDGLLVDALNDPSAVAINPSQIVTTGDSGGGGPSWDLALSQDQVVQLSSTVTPAAGSPPWTTSINTQPWTSPRNATPLHLAAALPMYTWTDLVDSLVSNGRSSDGFHGAPADGNHFSPVGVEKQSYVGGLFLKGLSNVPQQPPDGAQYVTAPNSDPTADLIKWFTEINAGEPTFGLNPDTPGILAQIGGPLRSPFAIPVPPPGAEKPIFVIQGLTDPLFPALQPLTMINRLKSVDASYPVYGFLGDVGHSYAQNPRDVWQQAHDTGNAWLNSVLSGVAHPALPAITVDTTRCVAGQTLQTYAGSSFGSIATSVLSFSSAAAQTTSSAATDTEGPQTDPIVSGGCKSIPASSPSDAPQATYVFPASGGLNTAFTLVGSPVVTVSANLAGTDAELAGRLWDVDPTGKSTLVSRTVYRLDGGTSPTTTAQLAFELWPNAWQFQCGHSIKLELTQVDSPTWRADNEPSTMTLTNLGLQLPGIANPGCALPAADVAESPFIPALPLLALPAAGALLLRRRRRGSATAP